MDYPIQTPVAFFIFRRPETTRQVFHAIARAKPTALYVIADGPRTLEEAAMCNETRAIVEAVDWDCKVVKNYAETNLGLKERFASGLNWLFEQVEEAIILEDDCLPSDSFFPFCEEMLNRYRHEPRIMHISGDNFLPHMRITNSYYFSRYPHIWGWATWRRAWNLYDQKMTQWQDPAFRRAVIGKFASSTEADFWGQIWDLTYRNEINTWDYQWAFACISHGCFAINPSINLVSNIGFGVAATHTTNSDLRLSNLPVGQIPFPLIHPSIIQPEPCFDRKIADLFFSNPTLLQRAIRKLLKLTRFAKLQKGLL